MKEIAVFYDIDDKEMKVEIGNGCMSLAVDGVEVLCFDREQIFGVVSGFIKADQEIPYTL